MAKKLHVFTIATKTKEGYPVLIVGSTKKVNQVYIQVLEERFQRWELPIDALTEPFLLDFYLAKELVKNAPPEVLVLGATIEAPLSHGCSGGVIGDPHLEPRSVNLYTENLREGLVLVGSPGGPGFVLQGSEEQAWILNTFIAEMDRHNGAVVLQELILKAESMGIAHLIAVADGSGQRKGAIALLDEGRIEVLRLGEKRS